MRAERRHELRENDLAQQIEQMVFSVQRHRMPILVILLGVVILVVVGVWYYNHNASVKAEAWATLMGTDLDEEAAAKETPEQRVDRFSELAAKKITNELTAMALKGAGDAALEAMQAAKTRGDSTAASEWAQKAEDYYKQVRDEFSTFVVTDAAAKFGLAFLAEERGAYTEAEAIYGQIREDQRYRNSPYGQQAQYRLDHLKNWQQRVVFAPATRPVATAPLTPILPGPPAPAATRPAATQPVVPKT